MSPVRNILFLFYVSLIFPGCNTPPPARLDVADGIYVTGKGTIYPEPEASAAMEPAVNAATSTASSTLFEKYLWLDAGSGGFSLVQVSDGEATMLGPGPGFSEVLERDLHPQEPREGLWKGSYNLSEFPFTLPVTGLVHVVVDTEEGSAVIARVNWSVSGEALSVYPDGEYPMTASGDSLAMAFVAEEVILGDRTWLFRYSGGWMISLDPLRPLKEEPVMVSVPCTLGGRPERLVTGGSPIAGSEPGIYTITLHWDADSGFRATSIRTGDAEPAPDYPRDLFMCGNSTGGDNWNQSAIPMIPVHSHPGSFWRILWLEPGVADPGFRVSALRSGEESFGIADTAGAAPGEFLLGEISVPVPSEPGYYQVWIDLEKDSLSIAPPEVYLIGAAIGDVWITANGRARFTVDNPGQRLTITRELTAGELRMYAWHRWHHDWWQHEFMILNGQIQYRGRGEVLQRVRVNAGVTTIDLNFKTGEGSITL